MEKLKIRREWKPVALGIIMGAIGGYSYYYFIGCNSGSCRITTNPVNSTLYGAFMGALLLATFKTKKIHSK